MTSVDDAFNNAPEAEVDAETVARELAKLSPLAYDQRREEEAKRLGVRAKTLDETVRRIRGAGDAAGGEMKSPFTDPEPFRPSRF